MKIKKLVRILVSDTRRNVRSGRIFTARKRSLGQGNIFSSVCREFCSYGGWSASVHAGIPLPPGSRHPPSRQSPLEQTPPEQCMLGDTVNKRAVCILLECNLVLCCEYPCKLKLSTKSSQVKFTGPGNLTGPIRKKNKE